MKNKVLGLNSRNHLYTSRYNTKRGKKIANSKLLTKKVLRESGIRVPKTYGIIHDREELEQLDWLSLPRNGFVIKPNNGLGGQGILIIDRAGKYAGEWLDSDGNKLTIADLKLHLGDILQGRYSMDDLADKAYIEELIRVHPVFKKYVYHGTPDIRVIVFNRVPIMAMLRLPTEESGGKANMYQGAVAVGVDIATGVTTYAVHHAKLITFLPGTRRKVRHLQIPGWDEVLETAVKVQEAVPLGYLGVDLVLQPKYNRKGELVGEQAVVLEINAQPGLKIQLTNMAGLWERLQRIEGLKITSVKQGVRVGRALFADPRLTEKGLGRKTIGVVEEVELVDDKGEKVKCKAKIDTGADSSSIDRKLAEELGLLKRSNVLYENYFRSALGRRKRLVVQGTFYLAGRKIKSLFSITDRSRLKYKVLIGKRDLKGFVIVP